MPLLQRIPRSLAKFLIVDAIASAIPLQYIKDDLDRIGCPEQVQKAIPVIKALAAAGLLLGRRHPGLGRFTALCLVLYFAVAVGFHVKAHDEAVRSLPAAGLLGASLVSAAIFSATGTDRPD